MMVETVILADFGGDTYDGGKTAQDKNQLVDYDHLQPPKFWPR
jgi:hypothetical protein